MEYLLEEIRAADTILALIIKNAEYPNGVHFFTPPSYSQQVALMNHKPGKTIKAHVHNPVSRTVEYTNEVLVIKKGKIRVNFFDTNRIYHCSRVLEQGDVVILVSGGHGFEVLEELEMIEVKQGPYAGEMDKTQFDGVVPHDPR